MKMQLKNAVMKVSALVQLFVCLCVWVQCFVTLATGGKK